MPDRADVQHTTLGVDVLGRYVCNTWDETASGVRRFDAIVIGAGMFGGYVAEKIYRWGGANNLKVLVLDSWTVRGANPPPELARHRPLSARPNVPGQRFRKSEKRSVGHRVARERSVCWPSLLRRGQVALLGRLVPQASCERSRSVATDGCPIPEPKLSINGAANGSLG